MEFESNPLLSTKNSILLKYDSKSKLLSTKSQFLCTNPTKKLKTEVTNYSSCITSFKQNLSSNIKYVLPTRSFNSKLLSIENKVLKAHSFKNLKTSFEISKLGEVKKLSSLNTSTNEKQLIVATDERLLLDADLMPKYDFSEVNSAKSHKKQTEYFFGDGKIDEYEARTRLIKKVQKLKASLLTTVSASLVNSPNFKNPRDKTRIKLTSQAEEISKFDPEFILKTALYTRQELNIRSTTNFLLAYAANCDKCKLYLRKYFEKSTRLPTDWLEVAEIYQTFDDKKTQRSSIPAMLRKVMVEKFQQFDEYQLAKYNRPNKKKSVEGPEMAIQTLFEETEIAEKSVTLKRFIRLLHINKPVKAVMCLLGKKYPANEELYRVSGLPGSFDPENAGKRMKLDSPLTWETQISLNGNKSEVWEHLLDEKKLPYMAMLRNLRNIILTNVSSKHHDLVIKLLSNEKSVVNSRQFPLAFYSAYQAVKDIDTYKENSNKMIKLTKKSDNEKISQFIAIKKLKKKTKNVTQDLLDQYKNALEKALEISMLRIVDPIPGQTLVIYDLISFSESETISKENLKLCKEMLLLALMCFYACENCDLTFLSSADYQVLSPDKTSLLSDLNDILKSVENVLRCMESQTDCDGTLRLKELLEKLMEVQNIRKQPINNLVLLTNGKKFVSGEVVEDFLKKYRLLFNPNLLYVQVDVSGQRSPDVNENPLNVNLSGTSDQILKFLSSQGTDGQVDYVENIDSVYNLKPLPKGLQQEIAELNVANYENFSKLLPKIQPPLEWRTIRVFISSTFKDMHGERDLLVRFLFPELRSRAKELLVNVHEVDLRWGITEEEALKRGSLELCLSEVSRCHYFIGILGERYGTIPELSKLPDEPQFDWVREYGAGTSITELEMHSAALSDPESALNKSFFYFRDNSFENNIPEKWKSHFLSESRESAARMVNLKKHIKKSGLEVFDGYPCRWGSEINKTPVVFGLEDFGQRVLDNLWNAIKNRFSADDVQIEDNCTLVNEDLIFGREQLFNKCVTSLESVIDNFLIITGKPGSGKTAFMNFLSEKLPTNIVCFINQNCSSIFDVLDQLCNDICSKFGILVAIPTEKQNLVALFWNILSESVKRTPDDTVIILIDGIDQLSKTEEQIPNWLPTNIKGVKLIISVTEASKSHQFLTNQDKGHIFFSIESLSVSNRKDLVSQTLGKYRKTLSVDAFNNQMLRLVTKKDAIIPEFLKLACEELRVFGDFEKLSWKIISLPDTISKLFQDIIGYLESQHGLDLVKRALIAISISHNGLDERQLHIILSASHLANPNNEQTLEEIVLMLRDLQPNQLIPIAQFSAFIRNLRNFLQQSSNSGTNSKIELRKTEIVKAINIRYSNNSVFNIIEITIHKLLAGYFTHILNPLANNTWSGKSRNAYPALLSHLISGQCYTEFIANVCSLKFISGIFNQSKIAVLIESVQGFIQTVSTSMTNKYSKTELNLKQVKDYLHFVCRYSDKREMPYFLMVQQALCEPENSAVFKDAQIELSNLPFEMFQWLSKPSQGSPCTFTLSNIPFDVFSCSTSPDCKYMALGGTAGTVRLHNAENGKIIRNFVGHSQSISCSIFVDNYTLCSGSIDGLICLWDVEAGFRKMSLTGHKKRVTSVCIDLTCQNLISSSWDQTIRVWSLRDGRQISQLETKSPINCIAQHPTKHLIVSGDWGNSLKIWDMGTLKLKYEFKGHKSSVQCVAFNSNGSRIVSGSAKGKFLVFSSQNGLLLSKFSVSGMSISGIRFTENDRNLITSSFDGKLTCWADHTKTTDWCKEVETNSLATIVTILSIDLVAFCFENGQISICQTSDGTFVTSFKLEDQITKIYKCYSKSCEQLDFAVAFQNGNIMLLKYKAGAEDSIKLLGNIGCPVTSLVAAKSVIIAGGANGNIYIYFGPTFNNFNLISAHPGVVNCLAFNQDDQSFFLSGSSDNCVKIWEITDSFDIIEKTKIEENNIHDEVLVLAANQKMIVISFQDTSLKVFDYTSHELIDYFVTKEIISKLQILGKYIVSISVSGEIVIWETATDDFEFSVDLNPEHINTVLDYFPEIDHDLYDSENKRPIKGFIVFQNSINIFGMVNLFSYSPVCQWAEHTAPITCIASLGNECIISASLDGSLKWWNTDFTPSARQEEELITQLRHKAKIILTQISGDGKFVLSSDNSVLLIWEIKTESDKEYLTPIGKLQFKSGPRITAASFASQDGKKVVVGLHNSKSTDKLYSLANYEIGASLELNLIIDNVLAIQCEMTNIFWCAEHDTLACSFKFGVTTFFDSNLMEIASNKFEPDWVLSSNMQNSQSVITLNAKGTVSKQTFRGPFRDYAKALNNTKNKPEVIFKSESWLSTLSLTEYEIIMGDDKGCLIVKQDEKVTIIKAHSDIISGISLAINNKYAFTSSKDKTIKVWELKTLKPVGEFTCSMPITSLSTKVAIKNNSSGVLVVAGTENGEIHLLKWTRINN